MGAASNGKQPFVLSVIFDDVGIISIFLASAFLPHPPAAAAPARHAARAGRGKEFSYFLRKYKTARILETNKIFVKKIFTIFLRKFMLEKI